MVAPECCFVYNRYIYIYQIIIVITTEKVWIFTLFPSSQALDMPRLLEFLNYDFVVYLSPWFVMCLFFVNKNPHYRCNRHTRFDALRHTELMSRVDIRNSRQTHYKIARVWRENLWYLHKQLTMFRSNIEGYRWNMTSSPSPSLFPPPIWIRPCP